jgi:hypothetical protein
LCGNVISNFGVISPGLSPGQLTIEGGYSTVDRGKFVLEIESNGPGQFTLDSILFKGVSASDLMFAGTEFEFSFLGNTNPEDALSQLPLSSFFLFDNGSGVQGIDALGVPLDLLFAGTTFLARSDSFVIESFSYTPSGGFASITASPVPVPATLPLMALGLLCLGLVGRQRRMSALLCRGHRLV